MATKNPMMNAVQRRTVENNLFWAAHPAVEPWEAFHWHGAPDGGATDAYKEHSSQALAIDVFGTLQASPHRDAVLNQLAAQLNLPAGGPWELRLEWSDADNYLNERQPTWVDAVARSPRTLIFFECKFTEYDGGACSQTLPLRTGPRRGLVQCNGSYAPQMNPATGVEAYCALTGKGIRYWDVIPEVFTFPNDLPYWPCPFAGPRFQWMRNLTVCYEVAQHANLRPACVVVYADGPTLPMSERIRSAEWERFTRLLRPNTITFQTLTTQAVVAAAQAAAPDEVIFAELALWVRRKIDSVCRARQVEGESP